MHYGNSHWYALQSVNQWHSARTWRVNDARFGLLARGRSNKRSQLTAIIIAICLCYFHIGTLVHCLVFRKSSHSIRPRGILRYVPNHFPSFLPFMHAQSNFPRDSLGFEVSSCARVKVISIGGWISMDPKSTGNLTSPSSASRNFAPTCW